MRMDPQQELFSELLVKIKELGYDVYDGFLPPDGTPYPFIYLADNQQEDRETKTELIGKVFQMIHFWNNNPKKRGTVSQMILDVKKICRTLEHTSNFSWFVKNMNQRIITDSTTKQPLMHGILEVEFSFS